MSSDTKPVEPNLFTMGAAAGEAVKDLVTQHWPAIEAIMLTTHKKQSVGVTLTFKRLAEHRFNMKAKIRFAETHSDEREDTVGEDPNQQKMPFGMKG